MSDANTQRLVRKPAFPDHQPISGTPRNDDIAATDEMQALFGLAGDDAIFSAFNHSALFGGSGQDKLEVRLDLFEDWVVHVPVEAHVDGGSGNDLITVDVVGFLYDANFDIVVEGGSGDDRIDVSVIPNAIGDSYVFNTIFGGNGNDVVSVYAVGGDFYGFDSEAHNEVFGEAGDDHITATAVAFANYGYLASNHLDGGSGNDVLSATTSTDSNSSSSRGVNSLVGGSGHDELIADHITDGENGSTSLISELSGGSGNDALTATMLSLAEFSATGENLLDGGSGDDVLSASIIARTAPGDMEYQTGPEASNRLFGGSGKDSLSAFADTSYSPSYEDEEPPAPDAAHNLLDGGAGDDRLTATVAPRSDGASELYGGAGRDVLTAVGGSGNVLDGGSGQDALLGGAGEDRLRGGTGDDSQDGGGGADRFVFRAGDGRDAVTGFEDGLDVIEIETGADDLSDVAITAQGADTLIRFANVAILLKHTDASSIDGSDFAFV